ncbi:nucleotidyltransferase domain-containing protein [Candidatus Pacearchaeota archaeon]|nr:nucleotidyltransferase domain-containing protein [Candidatus Pacearchaeota archaeon]
MIQKCSYLKVFEVFFKEPTKVHFIREISRNIKLATTSVKKHLLEIENEGLIKKKPKMPFEGYVANKENDKFLQYKQIYNLYSLIGLKNKIIDNLGPKAIILFGSYQKGEDREESDIDMAIISNIKLSFDLEKYEKVLQRKIHITFIKSMDDLEESIKNNVKNGWVLYGKI